MNEIKVPVSPGELLDKITILRIKSRAHDGSKKTRQCAPSNSRRWRTPGRARHTRPSTSTATCTHLLAVNERLWDIEDDIRDKERDKAFDAEFVRLARAVYIENDERAAIKRRLNLKLGSTLIEEKSYADTRASY